MALLTSHKKDTVEWRLRSGQKKAQEGKIVREIL
jgi:hypothetical protein